eukprot:TRINITY_DN5767_c0_g1_i1.p1 TRINITY_DN5767_c0_g1~~TRINITY_DN5767_c0_g1_i1.p1  ORF type:complete len:598 (-),score=144.86 TRINITY_DN5767_c0_g1_i1:38-1795(-)
MSATEEDTKNVLPENNLVEHHDETDDEDNHEELITLLPSITAIPFPASPRPSDDSIAPPSSSVPPSSDLLVPTSSTSPISPSSPIENTKKDEIEPIDIEIKSKSREKRTVAAVGSSLSEVFPPLSVDSSADISPSLASSLPPRLLTAHSLSLSSIERKKSPNKDAEPTVVKEKQKEKARKKDKKLESLGVHTMRDEEFPQTANDFVFVPYHLERFILFGVLLCLESLLGVLIFLPIRFCLSLKAFINSVVDPATQKFSKHQMIDLVSGILMAISLYVSSKIAIENVSDLFTKEALLKLKITYTVFELFNSVLIAFGNNIMGSLFWAITRPPEVVVERGKAFFLIVAAIYNSLHAAFLVFHIAVLDAALDRGDYSLFTLLFLVQFAEMKSSALKHYDDDGLYNMSCEDVCERTQVLIYVLLLLFHNMMDYGKVDSSIDSVEKNILMAAGAVYFSELIVDWLKHTSIINLTRKSPNIYTKYLSNLCKFYDSVSIPHGHQMFFSRSMHVANEIGFYSIPMVALVYKIVWDWSPPLTIWSVIGWAVAVPVLIMMQRMLTKVNDRIVSQFKTYTYSPSKYPPQKSSKKKD